MENTKWVLKERPIGLVKDSDFELIKEEIGELVPFFIDGANINISWFLNPKFK